MSLKLTDFLVAVSDPQILRRFRETPEQTMTEFGLSDEEKEVVRTGSAGKIRVHAISVSPPTDEYRQFTSSRAAAFNPALVEIDPVVEVNLQENEQVTISGRGTLFIDENGQLFTGVPN